MPLPCAREKLRNNGTSLEQHLRNTAHWTNEEDHFAPHTFRSGIGWLEEHYEGNREQPFMLWLDTFDPHEPWDAPQYYVDRYDPGYVGEVLAHANYGRADYMTEAERQHVKALYAGEISMVDRWFGRLIEQLDLLGYSDDTAVIHISDHGHYFGDHGLQGKPFADLFWLYEGLIRSALAIRLPERCGRADAWRTHLRAGAAPGRHGDHHGSAGTGAAGCTGLLAAAGDRGTRRATRAGVQQSLSAGGGRLHADHHHQ